MKKNKIEQIKDVLIEWHPAKKSLLPITDLDNYDTEVGDFIFNLEIEYDYPENKVTNKQAQRILKEVLNQAFNLHLSDSECEESSIRITQILNEN